MLNNIHFHLYFKSDDFIDIFYEELNQRLNMIDYNHKVGLEYDLNKFIEENLIDNMNLDLNELYNNIL